MAKETQEVVEKKHLETWNKVKTPPDEALKDIKTFCKECGCKECGHQID